MQSWLQACEASLCRATSHGSLEDFLAALRPTDCGQCTAIWVAGALAYRCRTCQLTPASAVCVACFRDGGHEAQGHDWVVYRSPCGGCCDCGDTGSWREEGCCPAHSPGRQGVDLSQLLSPRAAALLSAVLTAALARLTECLEGMAARPARPLEGDAALLIAWLQPFAALASLRPAMCAVLSQPLAALQQELQQRQQQQGAQQEQAGQAGAAAEGAPDAELCEYWACAVEAMSRLPQRAPPTPPLPGIVAAPDCLLRRWTLALRWLPREPLSQFTTLFTALLYEAQLKRDAAIQLTEDLMPMLCTIAGVPPPASGGGGGGGGAPLAAAGARHPLTNALDRLLVQLCNSPSVTLELVREWGVMDTLLRVLAYLVGSFADALRRACAAAASSNAVIGASSVDEAEQQLGALLDAMRRIASDFHTIILHPPVAQHVLSNRAHVDALLNGVVRPLQAMLPHTRRLTGDPDACALLVPLSGLAEYVINTCITELLCTGAGLRPSGAGAAGAGAPAGAAAVAATSRGGSEGSGWSGGGAEASAAGGGGGAGRVELIYNAGVQALEACEEWCSDRLARSVATAELAELSALVEAASGSGPCSVAGAAAPQRAWRLDVAEDLYDGLMAGAFEASPHLPLHRTAAAFVQALLALEQRGGEQGRLARERVRSLLAQRASQDATSTAWRPISRIALLTQAFVHQVMARLWPRNAREEVESLVLNSRELMELDVLAIQVWMAAEEPGVALYDTVAAMGGKGLLDAAGVSRHADSPPPSAAPADLHDHPARAAEALRWLVTLLRDRGTLGLAPRERLRSHVVQWLALRSWTYNQLQELMPQDLHQRHGILDEVLSEVATFRAASLQQTRTYTLKREAWELFSPFALSIAHVPSLRAAAMAATSGASGYRPRWQLSRPRHPLPASLAPMARVLEQPGLWRLVLWVMQAFASGTSLPEDTLMATLNLLALQLHHTDDLLELLQQQQQQEEQQQEQRGSGGEAAAGTAAMEGVEAAHAAAARERARQAAATAAAALCGSGPPARGPRLCVVAELEALTASSQQQQRGGGAAGSSSGTAGAISAEALDCCQWLLEKARASVQACRAAGLIAAPPQGYAAEAAPAGGDAGGASSAAGSSGPTASSAAAGGAGEQRRAIARERQAALLARMRAQQQAFMQKAMAGASGGGGGGEGGGGPGGSDSDDDSDHDGRPATAAPGGGAGSLDVAMQDAAQPASGPNAAPSAGGAGQAPPAQQGPVAARSGAAGAARCPAALPPTIASHAGSVDALPLGTWLPIDLPDAECVVCHAGRGGSGDAGAAGSPGRGDVGAGAGGGGGGGGGGEELSYIAHVTVCSSMAQQLRPRRAWDAPALPTAAAPAAAAAAGSSDPARRAWLDAWAADGPCVSEADMCSGMHALACGHLIHPSCHGQLVAGQLRLYLTGHDFMGSQLVVPELSEFLCPVCRRLANCILPAAPFQWRGPQPVHAPSSHPLQDVDEHVEGSVASMDTEDAHVEGMDAEYAGSADEPGAAALSLPGSGPGAAPAPPHGDAPPAASAAPPRQRHQQPGAAPPAHADLPPLSEWLAPLAAAQAALPAVRALAERQRTAAARAAGRGGSAYERAFGAHAEEVVSLHHQMTREGANHMAQLERSIEARALAAPSPLLTQATPPPPAPPPAAALPPPDAPDAPHASAGGGGPAEQAAPPPPPLLPPLLPPPPPPGLRTVPNRAADVISSWKAAAVEAKLWAAVAHGVAHVEATARPVALAAQVLEPCAAAAPITSMPALTAMWRSLQAIISVAVCAGGLPPGAPGSASACAPHSHAHPRPGSGSAAAGAALAVLQDAFGWLLCDPSTLGDAAATAAGAAAPEAAPTVQPPPGVALDLTSALLPLYRPELSTSPGPGDEVRSRSRAVPSTSFPPLAVRRLATLVDLAADPLLLTVELLAVGISGLVGPAPADAALHLPATPQQLLRLVLRAVYPMQVVQAALWQESGCTGGGSEPAGPAPARQPGAAGLTDLYLRALAAHSAGAQQQQRAQHQPSGSAATTSATAATIRSEEALSAQVLPFMMRAYVLHCALARQEPDAQLLCAYSAAATASDCAAVAAALAAALELPPAAVALTEPLALSRRRAAELAASLPVAAASAASGSSAAACADAGVGGAGVGAGAVGRLERAVLDHVLARWCGARALAWARPAALAHGGAAAPAAAPTAVLPPLRRLGLLPPPSLIPLPPLFQSLFMTVADATCPDCGLKPAHPALCLVTGRLYCSLMGGCVEGRGGGLLHARERCGGTAVLLSLRTTRITILRANRLAMCQSPYLDSHGDEDPDLRRGRPLYLDARCYGQLSRLWGSGALDFDTRLLHTARGDLMGL